jgi:hypothetical protein
MTSVLNVATIVPTMALGPIVANIRSKYESDRQADRHGPAIYSSLTLELDKIPYNLYN